MTLSTAELTSMRTQAQTFMPDSCVVRRTSNVADGSGGNTTTTATVGTHACNGAAGPYMRFGAEKVVAGQTTPAGIIFLSLPWNADVQEADRIEWTKAGGAMTAVEVTQVGTRSWEINKRVAAKEIG